MTTNSFTPDPDGKYYKLKDGTYTTTEPTPETTNQYDNPDQKYALTQTVTWTGTNTSSTTIAGDVGQDGYLTFGGLGKGTYTIEETKVPTGYNKIDDITVTLSFTPPQTVVTGQEKGTWSATYKVGSNGSPHAASVDTDGTIHFQVENRSGAVLPSTGGMGTTLFVAGGLVLMVVAATLLVVRARAARKDQEENQN